MRGGKPDLDSSLCSCGSKPVLTLHAEHLTLQTLHSGYKQHWQPEMSCLKQLDQRKDARKLCTYMTYNSLDQNQKKYALTDHKDLSEVNSLKGTAD